MCRSFSSTCFQVFPASSERKMPPPSPCCPAARAQVVRYRRLEANADRWPGRWERSDPAGKAGLVANARRHRWSDTARRLRHCRCCHLPSVARSAHKECHSQLRASRQAKGCVCVMPLFFRAPGAAAVRTFVDAVAESGNIENACIDRTVGSSRMWVAPVSSMPLFDLVQVLPPSSLRQTPPL